MTTSLHTIFHSLSELLGALRGPGTAEKQGAEAAPSLCALPELTRGERLTRGIADEAMPTSEAIRRLKDESNRFISNFMATEPEADVGGEKREKGKSGGQVKKKPRQGG